MTDTAENAQNIGPIDVAGNTQNTEVTEKNRILFEEFVKLFERSKGTEYARVLYHWSGERFRTLKPDRLRFPSAQALGYSDEGYKELQDRLNKSFFDDHNDLYLKQIAQMDEIKHLLLQDAPLGSQLVKITKKDECMEIKEVPRGIYQNYEEIWYHIDIANPDLTPILEKQIAILKRTAFTKKFEDLVDDLKNNPGLYTPSQAAETLKILGDALGIEASITVRGAKIDRTIG